MTKMVVAVIGLLKKLLHWEGSLLGFDLIPLVMPYSVKTDVHLASSGVQASQLVFVQ